MTFSIRSYEEMKGDWKTKVREVLLRNHSVRDESGLPDFPEPRRQQVQFLNMVIQQLEEYKPAKAEKDNFAPIRSKVLTGCLYTIFDIIKCSYETSPLNTVFTFVSPTRSDLYTILKEVMGVTETNCLDLYTIRSMMQETEKFLASQLCIDGNLAKDIKLDHPFVSIVHPDAPARAFDLREFIVHAVAIREKSTRQSWDDKFTAYAATHQEEKKKEQAAKAAHSTASTSRFSLFTTTTTTKSIVLPAMPSSSQSSSPMGSGAK